MLVVNYARTMRLWKVRKLYGPILPELGTAIARISKIFKSTCRNHIILRSIHVINYVRRSVKKIIKKTVLENSMRASSGAFMSTETTEIC